MASKKKGKDAAAVANEILGNKDGKVKREDFPDVEREFTARERKKITGLIDETIELKTTIGDKPDERKNKPGSGLLGQYAENLQELASIQGDRPGLRFGRVWFSASVQDGRKYTDMKKLVTYLVEHGVKSDVISAALEHAESRGDPFMKREINFLKQK